MVRRIVVFTGNPSHAVCRNIVEIDRAVPDLRWLIVFHRPQRTIRRLLRNQWLNLRRNGWRWIPYQLADAWRRLRARGNAQGASPDALSGLLQHGHVELLRVSDLRASETLQAVGAFEPDLGLSLSAPILRPALFRIPRHGTLNLHKGKVPDYRGMPPAFWELWNGERQVGCTVHWVDDKLDTGDIVAQTVIERAPHATLRGLQLCLDEAGIRLMVQAVSAVLDGTARRVPQPAGGKTYRKPRLSEIGALRRKLGSEASPAPWSARTMLKDSVARATRAAWPLGLGRVLAPRITVVLYHRVSDDVRDNLTVGIEQFDRQIGLLRRHCDVLTIQQVLASRSIAHNSRPQVCVTFDDGYLDNYEHAAPILLTHGVPAAFFVSTGIVGTDQRFPHDLRRGNPPIPVMQWDQLRKMRRDGFTIGSHAVSHIDCAGEPKEQVWDELVRSRDDLRRELGIDDVVFAYPYGGRRHMTPERLELVKQAGYVGCLSAYGGSNVRTVDPFDVRRIGIQWQFSDPAFLFACLGLR